MLSYLFSPFGRIGRGGWWLNIGLQFALLVGIVAILGISLTGEPTEQEIEAFFKTSSLLIPIILVFVLLWWSSLCSSIKRYHDRGKSGFWTFIWLIPIIGPIWQFIELGFCSGDEDENGYGPAPGSDARREAFANELASLGNRAAPKNNSSAQVITAKVSAPVAQAPRFGSTPQPMFGKRV